MNNGTNTWNVTYGRIVYLENTLRQHKNVVSVERHDDIIFNVIRHKGENLTLICLDEYALGIAGVKRVQQEFPDVNLISVGGAWNGYTREAKQYCLAMHIGLYNLGELAGALWKEEFWEYAKKDDDGNPIYPCRNS
jgi:hypothetical protein